MVCWIGGEGPSSHPHQLLDSRPYGLAGHPKPGFYKFLGLGFLICKMGNMILSWGLSFETRVSGDYLAEIETPAGRRQGHATHSGPLHVALLTQW